MHKYKIMLSDLIWIFLRPLQQPGLLSCLVLALPCLGFCEDMQSSWYVSRLQTTPVCLTLSPRPGDMFSTGQGKGSCFTRIQIAFQ